MFSLYAETVDLSTSYENLRIAHIRFFMALTFCYFFYIYFDIITFFISKKKAFRRKKLQNALLLLINFSSR